MARTQSTEPIRIEREQQRELCKEKCHCEDKSKIISVEGKECVEYQDLSAANGIKELPGGSGLTSLTFLSEIRFVSCLAGDEDHI